ncbi:MAG: hypothetical protein Q9217_000814 [Psora testacea]
MDGQTRRRLPNLLLVDFVEERGESKLSQRIAGQSSLPHSDEHKKADYLGENPDDVGTSLCVDATNISSHPSLPCLIDSHGSSAPCSVASSPDPTTSPPLRDPLGPVLECPFDMLPCKRAYLMGHFDKWIKHSLKHFVPKGSRRRVEPATSNQCPFCEAIFDNPSGTTSWMQRMEHVAHHHRIGDSLSHARLILPLYEYLWQQKIIGLEVYREIRANSEDLWRMVHGQHTLPSTGSGSIEERPRVYTLVNEYGRTSRSRRPKQ